MSHLPFLRRLYTYNDIANRKTLASIQTTASELTLKRMAHILAAEYAWYSRLMDEPSHVPVWPELTIEEMGEHIDILKDKWVQYLDNLSEEDLTGTIEYHNSKGKAFTSRRDDILQHVAMHGAYHRGQIAADVRASGEEPAVTDYIFFARDGVI